MKSDQVPGINFKDAYNWLRCHEPALYKEYRKLHPQDANQETLDAFVKGKINIPNMKLVSGSIGKGAYGSLWRNWEDTRITTVADYETHNKARGYKLVVKIDDSKCVITETSINCLSLSSNSRPIQTAAALFCLHGIQDALKKQHCRHVFLQVLLCLHQMDTRILRLLKKEMSSIVLQ